MGAERIEHGDLPAIGEDLVSRQHPLAIGVDVLTPKAPGPFKRPHVAGTRWWRLVRDTQLAYNAARETVNEC